MNFVSDGFFFFFFFTVCPSMVYFVTPFLLQILEESSVLESGVGAWDAGERRSGRGGRRARICFSQNPSQK